MTDIHPSISTSFAAPRRSQTSQDNDVSADAPMTFAQMAELLCLSQRAEEPDAYDEGLTRAEATNRIKLLKRKLDG